MAGLKYLRITLYGNLMLQDEWFHTSEAVLFEPLREWRAVIPAGAVGELWLGWAEPKSESGERKESPFPVTRWHVLDDVSVFHCYSGHYSYADYDDNS